MLKVLVNLLIFSLPLGVILRITPFSNFSFYPYDFFAGGIFLIFLYKTIIEKEKIKMTKIFILLCLFIGVGFVSLIFSPINLSVENFVISTAYLLRYAAYFSIFFVFDFLDDKFKNTVPNKLIFSGIIFMLAGFIQYIFYNDLRNLYYLGWDDHLYRLFSTFLDPNFAGAFLVLLALLLLGYIVNLYKNDKKKAFILSVILLLDFIAILFTYSRSTMLMLLIGIIVFLLMQKMFKFIVISGTVIICSYILFADTDIVGLNPLRIASVEARIESANEAIKIISDNAILGVGFNAYRYAQLEYGFRSERGTMMSNADAGTDNSFLFVLATTGVVGFILFISVWTNILKVLFNNIKKDKSPLTLIALSSLVAIFFNTVFINSIFYTPILTWILILAGVTVSRRH